LESEGVGEGVEVKFSGEFGGGVGGFGGQREEFVLSVGSWVVAAVGTGASGVDDALHAVLSGGIEHKEGACGAGVVCGGRVFQASGDGGEGCQMEDDAHAAEGVVEGVGVGDGSMDQFWGWVEMLEVVAQAGAEIVEDADGVSAGVESIDEMGADEAGTTGD
jgi:hypothetical protein